MRIIGGKFRNRRLKSPKGDHIRPTSSQMRESLFNILQAKIEGADFLDLFSGGGAIGLEALSRGAERVVFVEKNRQSLSLIRENVAQLKVEEQVEIFSGDAIKMLSLLQGRERSFSLIYADPPYGKKTSWKGESLKYSEAVVYAVERGNLLQPGGMLCVEEGKQYPLELDPLEQLSLKEERRFGAATLWLFDALL